MPHRDIRAPRTPQLKQIWTWRWQRVLLLVLSDILALTVAWRIAHFLNQFFSPIPDQLVWWVWLDLPSLFWIFVPVTLAVFAQYGLYGPLTQVKNYVRAAQLITAIYLLSLVLVYFYDPKLDPPRSLFFSAWGSSVALVMLARLLVTLVLRPIEQRWVQGRLFLIASARRLKLLSDTLQQRSSMTVVGSALATTANSPITLQAILKSGAQLVLAEDLPDATLASSLYWQLRRAGIALRLVPSSREMLYRRGVPEIFAGIPTLRLDAPLVDGLDYRLKRTLDYVGAALGMLVLAPLLLGAAIAIRLDSPGPIFFRQERIGLHGKVFPMWKFRTMAADAARQQITLETQNQSQDGILFKLKSDPRITRVGQFLRRTSLDELPQLFNVLWGQMSLVGPRPLPLRDVAHFDAGHHVRHQVLPGITGLWQISGRSDIGSFDDAARLDLHYIDNWSLNLDLDILMETLKIVLLGKGAY
ncbi:sugar transferase [Halomicronema hongdechloris]